MKNKVGVLLNQKRWRKLLIKNLDLEIKTLINHANLHEIELIFFSVDSIDLETLMLRSAYTQSLDSHEKIDIPKIIIKLEPLFDKNSIRIWRTLLLDRDFRVINEQLILKEKYLLAMMSSSPFFINFILDNKDNSSSFRYIGWIQLNNNLNHEITTKYCIADNNQILNWTQGILLQFPTLRGESIDQKSNDLAKTMISLMKYIFLYYPGIYEIGFSFILDSDGNPLFHSIINKKKILKEIYPWNVDFWEQLVNYPLEIATLYLKEEGEGNEGDSNHLD